MERNVLAGAMIEALKCRRGWEIIHQKTTKFYSCCKISLTPTGRLQKS